MAPDHSAVLPSASWNSTPYTDIQGLMNRKGSETCVSYTEKKSFGRTESSENSGDNYTAEKKHSR